MATNPKIMRLLESLRGATYQGRAPWLETFDAGSFELMLKDAKILLERQLTERGEQFYVNVGNLKGTTVESELLFEGDEGFDLASELYPLARRSALKVDDFLDRVIADVESGNTK